MRFLEDRKGHGNARAVSRGAFYPYVSSVIFDDPMGNGQAQAGALGLCCEEGLKDAIQMLFGDSRAFVFNHHVQGVLFESHQEPNLLSFRRCLESILEQVRKGMTHLLAV